MAEIINLRRAKKTKARAKDAKEADVNRAKFGASKLERNLVKARSEIEKARLDKHRLGSEPDEDAQTE